MKVNLAAMVEAGTQALTGMMAGQMAGQQMARQQQEQEFNRQLNLSQLGANQQHQNNQMLLSQFADMTPESRAQALTNIAAQPNPLAPVLNTRYARQHPETGQMLGIQPAPAAPVAGAVAPGGEGQPTFTWGGHTYAQKGVSKEQIAQRGVQIKATRELLRNQVAAITDPTVKAHAGGILSDLDSADITTPEGYAQAGQALQRADAAGYTSLGAQGAQQRQTKDIQTQFETEIEKDLGGLNGQALVGALPGHLQTERWIRQQRGKAGYGGKGLEGFAKEIDALPELAKTDPAKAEQQAEMIRAAISSKQSSSDQAKQIGSFYKVLSTIAPTDRTPERVRQLAKNFKLDNLLTGLDDEGLLLGGAAAEKAYQGLLQRMSTQNFAGLDKTAQSALLGEASTLAGYLGRKVPIPAEIIAKMTPWQQAQVGMQRDRLAISGDLRDVAWQNMMISNARLGLEERKLNEAQKQSKFTPQQMQTILAKRKAFSDAQEQLKTTLERLPVLPGNVDLDNPKNDAERLYADLIGKMRAAEDDYVGFMGTLGIPVSPVTDTGFKPTPPKAPVKTERKTILGIPYGPEVPVEGQQPGTQPAAAQAAPAASATAPVNHGQELRFSNEGQRTAKEAMRTKTPPAPPSTLDFVRGKMGAGWEPWVRSLSPANQQKAWVAYWYNQLSQSGKKANGSSGTTPKR